MKHSRIIADTAAMMAQLCKSMLGLMENSTPVSQNDLNQLSERYLNLLINKLANIQRLMLSLTKLIIEADTEQKSYVNRDSDEKTIDICTQVCTIKSREKAEDGGPGSGNRNHAGVPGQVGGSAPKPSSRGKNPKCVGFANEKLYKRHVMSHGKEYPEMTGKQYVEHAKEFLSQPCSDTVDGYVTQSGEVVRFDRTTGEYAKGVPGGRIVTCYIAKYNEKSGKSNLDLANAYFDRLKSIEGIDDDG